MGHKLLKQAKIEHELSYELKSFNNIIKLDRDDFTGEGIWDIVRSINIVLPKQSFIVITFEYDMYGSVCATAYTANTIQPQYDITREQSIVLKHTDHIVSWADVLIQTDTEENLQLLKLLLVKK